MTGTGQRQNINCNCITLDRPAQSQKFTSSISGEYSRYFKLGQYDSGIDCRIACELLVAAAVPDKHIIDKYFIIGRSAFIYVQVIPLSINVASGTGLKNKII